MQKIKILEHINCKMQFQDLSTAAKYLFQQNGNGRNNKSHELNKIAYILYIYTRMS